MTLSLELLALRVAVYLRQFPHASMSDLVADASAKAVQRAVELGYVVAGITGPLLTDAGRVAVVQTLEAARQDPEKVSAEAFALFSFETDGTGPIGPKPRH